MKQKFKLISGVTLLEMLLGIVISTIMMAALFTAYNVVNNSYSQVSNKAGMSRTGRDIVGMLLRDVRMAGHFDIRSTRIVSGDSLNPIKITKAKKFSGDSRECDKIEIVYGDSIYTEGANPEFTYPIYKITYECKKSKIPDRQKGKNAAGNYPTKDIFAIYKSKVSWDVKNKDWKKGKTDSDVNTYADELVIDHVEDLIFIPINDKGLSIKPIPTGSDVYKIRAIDIMIIIRSPDPFYKNKFQRVLFSLSDNARNQSRKDKFLRESIVVTAHNRNIGTTK